MVDWCLNVQRAIFQLYSGREHFKNLNATGLEARKGDGYGQIILPVQQVSVGPLIMSCYTGFLNVRRRWQSLNTGPRFYLRLASAGRVGCEFLHPAHPTDAPSSRRSSRSPFLYPGIPAGCRNRVDTCNLMLI